MSIDALPVGADYLVTEEGTLVVPHATAMQPSELERTLREARMDLAQHSAALASQDAVSVMEPLADAEVTKSDVLARELLETLARGEDTRLLGASGFAELLLPPKNRNWPAEQARRGLLLSARYGASTLYPAFQVDLGSGQVRGWVAPVAAALEESGLHAMDFILWAATPSARFGGQPPADRAGDPDFFERFILDLDAG